MDIINYVFEMLVRLRYPVSLPQDIACCLGVKMQNTVRFKDLLSQLTDPSLKLDTLTKYMPRNLAERSFHNALRKERFQQSSLYSFYFNEGWLEFELHFDEESRLRRIYIHHRLLPHHLGYELPLTQKPCEMIQTTSSESRCIA